jgi:hypothetical protein
LFFVTRHAVHAKAISSLLRVGKRLAMASVPTITPKKPTVRELSELLSSEYSTARKTILPILASSLSRHCNNQWVPVGEFFRESDLHELKLQNVFRRKQSSKQSKMRELPISVMPAEPAINARGISKDMSAIG